VPFISYGNQKRLLGVKLSPSSVAASCQFLFVRARKNIRMKITVDIIKMNSVNQTAIANELSNLIPSSPQIEPTSIIIINILDFTEIYCLIGMALTSIQELG
jgi:hypothetical protein